MPMSQGGFVAESSGDEESDGEESEVERGDSDDEGDTGDTGDYDDYSDEGDTTDDGELEEDFELRHTSLQPEVLLRVYGGSAALPSTVVRLLHHLSTTSALGENRGRMLPAPNVCIYENHF